MKQIARGNWGGGIREEFPQERGRAGKTQPADYALLIVLLVTLGSMLLRG